MEEEVIFEAEKEPMPSSTSDLDASLGGREGAFKRGLATAFSVGRGLDGKYPKPENRGVLTLAVGAVVTGCGGCEGSGKGVGAVGTAGVEVTWLVETAGASAMSISGEDIPLLSALELLVGTLKNAALGCDATELARVVALKADAVLQDPTEHPDVSLLGDDDGDDAAEAGGLPNTPPLASNAASWSIVSYSHSISSPSASLNRACCCSTKPCAMDRHVDLCRAKRASKGLCIELEPVRGGGRMSIRRSFWLRFFVVRAAECGLRLRWICTWVMWGLEMQELRVRL